MIQINHIKRTIQKNRNLIFLFVILIFFKTAEASPSIDIYIENVLVTDVPDCYGYASGSIEILANGGTLPYQYSIDEGASWHDSNIFTNLSSGTYTVRVRDYFIQTAQTYVNIFQPAPIQITNEVKTNVTGCYGEETGTITITASGGSDDLDYSIDFGTTFQDENVFTDLPAGIYRIVVTDDHGCMKTGSTLTITQPNELFLNNIDYQSVTGCFGIQNGFINITAWGGTAPLYYSIHGDNEADYQTGGSFGGLSGGTYDVVIKDSRDCKVAHDTPITLTEPTALEWESVTHGDVDCYQEGSGWILLETSGGYGQMSYSIDGGGDYSPFPLFQNLYPGVYDIVAKDANGCTLYGTTIEILQPDELFISNVTKTDVTTCFGNKEGIIKITALGGNPEYTYSVDGGENFGSPGQNIFTNLASSLYSVVVKDANGCTAIAGETITITQPSKFNVNSATSTQVGSCHGDETGTIYVSANGGTPSYFFTIDAWTTSYNSLIIDDIGAGTYTIIGKDSNGCADTLQSTVTVNEPSAVIISGYQTFDLTCYESMDGRISISAFGGTGSLLYSVNGGDNYTLNSVITNLVANEPYEISVRDGNNCRVYSDTVILSQPPEIIVDSVNILDITSCFGVTNGEIEIYVKGGTPGYIYSINSGSDYSYSNSFTDLEAGDYDIYVRDSRNCQKRHGIVIVNQPPMLNITSFDPDNITGCKGDSTGRLHIYATGGTEPLYYSIDNGETFVTGNNGLFEKLTAGMYFFMVEDANGCRKEGNLIYLSQPDTLIAEVTQVTNVTCFGKNNGIGYLTGTGGQSPYMFSIDGGTTFSSNRQYFNLQAGVYHTAIQDSYGCTRTGPDFTIIEPDSLMITEVSYQNIEQCYGQSTGSITIQSSGGTPTVYYSINTGASLFSSNVFTNLPAGSYQIVVEDINQCKTFHTSVITLTQPNELVISELDVTNIACHNETNGAIGITASGGTGALLYSVENGANFVPDNVFEDLPSGIYSVMVQDENGCKKRETGVRVEEPDSLQIAYIISTDESCIDFKDGTIRFVAYGGTPPFSFSIGNGYFSNANIANLPPGTYYPSVQDSEGCLTEHPPVTVGTPPNYATFTPQYSESCSPVVVKFNREFDSGITYEWLFGDQTMSSVNEPTHTYFNQSELPQNVQIRAVSISETGCRDTFYRNIIINPQPNLDFLLPDDTIYFPNTTVQIVNLSTPGYFGYRWDYGDGFISNEEHPAAHTYETCSDFDVKVTASNNWCTDSLQKPLVIVPLLPDMNIEMDTTNGCGPFTVQLENLSDNYVSAVWDMGDGTTFDTLPSSYTYYEPAEYVIHADVQGFCNISVSYDTSVYVWQKPIVNFEVRPDTVLPPLQPIRCYNFSEYGYTYLWEFGDSTTSEVQEAVHNYLTDGTYDIKLTVTTDRNCVDSLTLYSQVVVLPYGRVRFPNAFSPDGDGICDLFMPGDYGSIKSYELHIFNRTGERMFTSTNPDEGWDGRYRGRPCAQDVYVWMIKGVYLNGTPFSDAGDITLLR